MTTGNTTITPKHYLNALIGIGVVVGLLAWLNSDNTKQKHPQQPQQAVQLEKTPAKVQQPVVEPVKAAEAPAQIDYATLITDYESKRIDSFEKTDNLLKKSATMLVEYAISSQPDEVAKRAEQLIREHAIALKSLHDYGEALTKKLEQFPQAKDNIFKANNVFYTTRGVNHMFIQNVWVAAVNGESLAPATEKYNQDSKSSEFALMLALAHIEDAKRELGVPNLIDNPELLNER